MNKKQKIVLWIAAVVWIWIAFGGPYNSITYTGHRGLGAEPDEPKEQWTEIYYCFHRFTEILRAWSVLLVLAGIIFYSFKTH